MISNATCALSSGLMTLQAGQDRMDRSAETIARQTSVGTEPASQTGTQPATAQQISPPEEVNQALIEQNQGLYQAQAGAKVVQTAFNMMGTLLNAFA